jgi:hypothetical protein
LNNNQPLVQTVSSDICVNTEDGRFVGKDDNWENGKLDEIDEGLKE